MSNETKGVTTQMKALDEYLLMVVFMLFMHKLHVFVIFMFNLDKNMAVKG